MQPAENLPRELPGAHGAFSTGAVFSMRRCLTPAEPF
jgi:hypothetical protein